MDAHARPKQFCRAGARWISPGLVAVPGAPDGSRRGGLVRDPDGHAVQIVER